MVRAALIPTQTRPRSGPAGCASVSRNRDGKGSVGDAGMLLIAPTPGARHRGSVTTSAWT